MKLFSISLLFATALFTSSFAQQTGDFTITISTSDPLLSGNDLDIYFHVPTSYDANVPSKMIMGFHGLGNPDNSDQIRNYLSPLGDTLNAIVMCPDPYLQDQPPSEVVLNLAYDSVLTWYNIDTNQIYLTGYSAGSDVAAQYFFGEPSHIMKGLIWHSPGFFSSPDLSDPQEIPPVCLCTGTIDFTSIIQTGVLNNSLPGAGFPYLFNEISGVGHTMEYPAFTMEMLECISFIDANTILPNVGISESAKNKVSIYPNPISEGSSLIIKGVENGSTIIIRTITGQEVTRYSATGTSGKQVISGLSKKLNSGLYLLSIISDALRKVISSYSINSQYFMGFL